MNVQDLYDHLKRLGVELGLNGENLTVRAPHGVMTPDIRRSLADQKLGMVDLLKQSSVDDQRSNPAIQHVPREGRLPLSFIQQQLWFLDHLEGGDSSTYNVSLAVTLDGDLDVGVLKRALDEIFRRHEILRTRIASEDGVPVHRIMELTEFPFSEIDLSASEHPEAELNRVLNAAANNPFNLTRGPLCRAVLYKISLQSRVLLVAAHHICTDGWSMGIFETELSAIYTAYERGEPSPLPNLPLQFIDFAHHEHETQTGPVLEKELDYWTHRLDGADFVLELPADHVRPDVPSFRGNHFRFRIEGDTVDGLRELTRSNGATIYMTMLAAFNLLLCKYTGKEDILVGSPFSNRKRVELESVIGFFVNMVAVRTNLKEDPTFRELLARVRDEILETYDHISVPMELLVNRLSVPTDLSRNPLFQVSFALQSGLRKEIRLPGITTGPVSLERTVSKFDLMASISDKGDHFQSSFDYSTDLFDDVSIRRMAGHFQVLLNQIIENPSAPISTLQILTEQERHQILVEWRGTSTNYPSEKTIKELFEEVSSRYPDKTAIRFGDKKVTYEELNKRANVLSGLLTEKGIGPDVLVGLCSERSIDLIIGILAIAKSGGAYLPVDPDYPLERLAYILEDAQVEFVLVQAHLESSIPLGQWELIRLDCDTGSTVGTSIENAPTTGSSTDLAYMIYTSGSTGYPKGTLIEQRSVVQLVRDTNYIEFSASDTFLMFAPTTFDASTLEIWGPLLNGGTLAIAPPGQISLAELGEFIRAMGVTSLFLTTGLFNLMVEERLEDLANVRYLVTGGDVASPVSVRKAKDGLPDTVLVNGYGPTECTTVSVCQTIDDRMTDGVRIPIGRLTSNTTGYILDTNLNPVPVGVPGELFLGGDGLARGYHRLADLTSEFFIQDPFDTDPTARLYKTGDRVQWLSDGTIDFLGRFDDQIKLRGYRIEPAEIESVLNTHPRLVASIVLVQRDANGDKALVAYVTSETPESGMPAGLKEYLEARLPSYMIPTAFVFLDAFPLTQNDKIDRASLENPLLNSAALEGDVQFPTTAIEIALAEIWADVLGRKQIYLGDDFFGLGGHSLMALKVVSRIEARIGVSIAIRAVFEHSTLQKISRFIESLLDNSASNMDSDEVTEVTI